MKYFCFLLAAILCSNATIAVSEEIVISRPNTAATLPFADRYASVFFTITKEHFNVVVAFAVSSEGKEQLIRQVIQLDDGQTYRLSIGGYGDNQGATTISMTRNKEVILTNVANCKSRESIENCL